MHTVLQIPNTNYSPGLKVQTCCWIFVSPTVMLVIVRAARGQAVQRRAGGPWIHQDDGNCKQAAKIVLD